VTEGSPAAKAGLKQGDVIVEYDGRPVARAGDLPRAVAETPVGRAVPLKIVRDGKPLTLTATVGRLEDAREAKAEPAPGEPALGVSARTLTPAVAQQLGLREQRGVLIVDVREGSRAETAGLKAGDVIAEVDHRTVASVEDLQQALRRHPAGGPVLMLVQRDGDHLWLTVGA
jgi:serine protease Do